MMRRKQRVRRFERKDTPALCPFCEQKIPRPKALLKGDEVKGGHCDCGALFLFDESGKTGGQIMVDGLSALCDGDIDAGMRLRIGVDCEIKDIGYRERTHSLEPSLPGRGSFGIPKLWFFHRLG
jgi:hypothetical protein